MDETQGEFSIERLANSGSGREKDELVAARESDRRDIDQGQANGAAALEAEANREDAFPAALRRKYYVVAEKQGKEDAARFYADECGEYLAFKLAEDRLTTRLTAPEVIRDMIAVAEHRQWTTLHVRGSVEFRREAWLEASARDITVKGYEPTALDREALASRRAARQRYEGGRPEAQSRSRGGGRTAPNRSSLGHRAASNVTAIEAVEGRVDRRETEPNNWRSTAARFRRADQRTAVRDAELVGAVSQLVTIEKALKRAFPHDREVRERIMAVAKERIAEHLEQGRTFARTTIRERTPNERNHGERDDARRSREDVREKTRQRER